MSLCGLHSIIRGSRRNFDFCYGSGVKTKLGTKIKELVVMALPLGGVQGADHTFANHYEGETYGLEQLFSKVLPQPLFGIIDALKGMSESASAGISAIAGGIAEALVPTVVGLAVAVPANETTNKPPEGGTPNELRVDCFPQRLPRSAQQLFDLLPIFFGDAALLGFFITDRHRFGTQPGMFHHLLDWLLVNLRRQFGQSAIQISRLEPRRLFGVEGRVAALTNGLIKLDEMGQSFLVI